MTKAVSPTELQCRVAPGSTTASGAETANVTVSVKCGNMAICNSEPRESNADIKYTFDPALTPKAQGPWEVDAL